VADEHNYLITLTDVKAYLEEISTENDAVLTSLTDYVNASIADYLETLPEPGDVTDNFTGSGNRTLYLSRRPIIEITQVSVDGEPINDYYSDENGFICRSRGFKAGSKIVVTYRAGYQTWPLALKLAALKQVAFEYQKTRTRAWGVSSMSFPDGSVNRIQDDEYLPEVRQTLRRYRRAVFR